MKPPYKQGSLADGVSAIAEGIGDDNPFGATASERERWKRGAVSLARQVAELEAQVEGLRAGAAQVVKQVQAAERRTDEERADATRLRGVVHRMAEGIIEGEILMTHTLDKAWIPKEVAERWRATAVAAQGMLADYETRRRRGQPMDVPEVTVRDMAGDGIGPWRLFIGDYGVADWPSKAAAEEPERYAKEVARCVRRALDAGGVSR